MEQLFQNCTTSGHDSTRKTAGNGATKQGSDTRNSCWILQQACDGLTGQPEVKMEDSWSTALSRRLFVPSTHLAKNRHLDISSEWSKLSAISCCENMNGKTFRIVKNLLPSVLEVFAIQVARSPDTSAVNHGRKKFRTVASPISSWTFTRCFSPRKAMALVELFGAWRLGATPFYGCQNSFCHRLRHFDHSWCLEHQQKPNNLYNIRAVMSRRWFFVWLLKCGSYKKLGA